MRDFSTPQVMNNSRCQWQLPTETDRPLAAITLGSIRGRQVGEEPSGPPGKPLREAHLCRDSDLRDEASGGGSKQMWVHTAGPRRLE